MAVEPGSARKARRSPAGWLLGLALGGFFDGILLHQILQWHHLLSAVEGSALEDLHMQVMADGLFHAAMYVIAGLGLWLLLRDRHLIASARQLWGEVLVGFGGWHVVDALFSHWLLGIHRVRMDASQPLAWDVAWLVAFGLLPLTLGWWLGRGAGRGGGQRVAATGLAAAMLVAAPLAALPPPGSDVVVALFERDAGPGAPFRAAAAADGRVVWSDEAGSVSAIALGPAVDTAALYRQGAWLVSRSLVGVGCMAWLRG